MAAFVEGTTLYSDAQVAELRQYDTSAREIEATYPMLAKYKDLNAKIKLITDVIGALDEAIRIKGMVTSVAYSDYNYSGIIDDLKKLALVQDTQKRFNYDLEQRSLCPQFPWMATRTGTTQLRYSIT